MVLRCPRVNSRQLCTLTAISSLLLWSLWSAAEEPKAPFQIPRIDTRITVDGSLDEPVWDDAWSMTLDYEVRPGETTPAPVETEVLMFHDESRIYIGFRAHDPDPSDRGIGGVFAHVEGERYTLPRSNGHGISRPGPRSGPIRSWSWPDSRFQS